jgi:pimeloyl-ACP methyl ester carboxylesterase
MVITFRIFVVLTMVWAILAQSCAQFRITDAEAHKAFEKNGVSLTTKTIRAGDHNLHFAMTGADTLPTIIFIHGSPGSWSAFDRYMKDKDLLSRFRMISVDRPGFGDSDFGKAEHLEVQSKIISKLFVEWENKKPFFLVGHSLGGPLLIQLNADNPGKFAALVLLAASVDPKEEPKELWRYVADVPLIRLLVPGAFRPSNRELKYFKKDIYKLENKFDSVRCNVFIVHGTKDQFVPYGNVAYAERKLTHAASVQTTTIAEANHFIPWTKYEEIKAVLLQLK